LQFQRQTFDLIISLSPHPKEALLFLHHILLTSDSDFCLQTGWIVVK